MAIADFSLNRRCLLVGRTRRLLEEGKTLKEIAETLRISDDEVREFKQICDDAEHNRMK